MGDMSRTGIARTAVIGAGLMGHGIGQVFAENGCSVALYDIADTLLAGAMEKIRANLALYVELGLESREFAEGVVSRIRTTTDLADAVKDVQYVTEAIPEDLLEFLLHFVGYVVSSRHMGGLEEQVSLG